MKRVVVVLHPALKIEGAGRRHIALESDPADARIVTTRCGIRCAVMELAKPGVWYANCRRGCAG